MAAIPGWKSISLDGNMIDFLSDWDKARRFVKHEVNVLDLGMSYTYDTLSNADIIQSGNGRTLMLGESSGGVQSLLPMYVLLDYLVDGQYRDCDGKIPMTKRRGIENG